MDETDSLRRKKQYYRLGGVLTLLFFLTLAIGIFISIHTYPSKVGPRQPIPFSHRIHAGEKKIGCLVCHPEAVVTSTGGIPPLTTCMHCHSRIITSFEPIKDLHRYYQERKPILWNRITELPEFVYFPHLVHINRQIDCAICHGDVKKMDRIIEVHDINMGFCMSCHRKYNAPVDCFTCHR